MVGAGLPRGDGARLGPRRRGARSRATPTCVAFSNYWVVADEVHLLNLATHPEARRAGHASRLLAHIIEVGREPQLPLRHARGSALERRGAAALPSVRLQGGRRSPELLRGGPGRRDRDAAGPDLTWRSSAVLTLGGRRARRPRFAGFGVVTPVRRRAGAGRRRPVPLRRLRLRGRRRAAGPRALRPHSLSVDDPRAGRRDHVRRLRDAQPGLRLRSRRVRRAQARAGPGDDLRLRALGREPPRRDDRAGERAADRVRRSLVRSPAHVAAARRRASSRRSIRPRRRWASTASARRVPAAVRRLEPAADRTSSRIGSCRR